MECEITIKEEPFDDYEEERLYDDEQSNPENTKGAWEENVTLYMNGYGMKNNHDENQQESNHTTSIATERIKIKEEIIEEDDVDERFQKNASILENATSSKFIQENMTHYECRKACLKTFRTLTERALHESYEHKSKPRTIKCNFCNKYFECFFDLTRHMSEHRNQKRYVCTHCTECYNSYQNLQNHWKESADCYKNEYGPTRRTLKSISVKERPKISILKPNLPNKPTPEIQKILLNKQEENKKYENHVFPIKLPLSEKSPKKDVSSERAPPISLLPLSTITKPKPMTFAEETKAFAAKYQLKNNLVAKKRTSPLIVQPVNTKNLKRLRTLQVEKFVTISNYAVPNAIGPSNTTDSILNVKIKEEPQDDYVEEITAESDPTSFHSLDINTEHIDDFVEVKNEADTDDPIEEIAYSEVWKNNPKEVCVESKAKTHRLLNSNETIPLKNFRVVKLNVSSSKTLEKTNLPVFSTKGDFNQFQNTNKTPLTTIKIVKVVPNSTIAKLPTVKVESPDSLPNKPISIFQSNTVNSMDSFVPIKLPFKSNQQKIDEKISIKNEVSSGDDEKKTPFVGNICNDIAKQNKKRINCVPKEVLQKIESEPQKLKMIEHIQRQIQIAVKLTPPSVMTNGESVIERPMNPKTDEDSSECATEESIDLPPPKSLFLSVIDRKYLELNETRRRYRDYRFSWICPLCPKQYDRKSGFIGHLHKIHDMGRDEFEKMKFEVRPSLAEDAIRDKKMEDNKNRYQTAKTKYQCQRCERYCSSRTMLNDHITGNCSRIPLYECSECSKTFFSANTLACHMTIHTGELPHKCNYCDKRFRTRGQVTVHHRTHTGERPFACPVCSQRFTHRETLISHLSRHIGMKRYKCYACGKHFSCVSGLKTHHDLRPTSCGRVKLNTRAVGPRVRVVRGQVHFEPQPEINPYLRTEDPQEILSEIQNFQETNSLEDF